MRAIELDFAPRTMPLQRAGFGLLLAALIACAWTGAHYYESHRAKQMTVVKERELQRARKQSVETEATRKLKTAALQVELRAANRVIAHLALPWDRLFDEIENSVDDDVVLLAAIPDAYHRAVKITAEAKNLSAMSSYVKRLSQSALFKEPYVQNHQIQQDDPQHPVKFVVYVEWLVEPLETLSLEVAPPAQE
jgi:hypothetical protein